MRWTVHGRRALYTSPWIDLHLVDVELPDGRRYEHHAVGGPDAAGVLVTDPDRGTLMLWRHRVLADEWGWEIPGGMIDADESPEQAAARECIEETGHRPGPLRLLHRFAPNAGQSTQRFWIYSACSAEVVGEPDGLEADRIEWLDRDALAGAVERNEVFDAMSVIAVLHLLASATPSTAVGVRPQGRTTPGP